LYHIVTLEVEVGCLIVHRAPDTVRHGILTAVRLSAEDDLRPLGFLLGELLWK
jgi:hypothetical protein